MLIPFNGVLLALTTEQFVEARAAAAEIVPEPSVVAAISADELLSAEQLAKRTRVRASWWEQAARENRVPHVKIGRYVRFRFADVAEHLSRPLDSDSSGALRRWRKSRGCE